MWHSTSKPIPTALKILNGNPGRRPLNQNEPQPEARIPSCPRHLDAEARKEWRRISKELLNLGLLTAIDRAALAAYCQVWSRWIEAEQKVREVGTVVKTKSGYPILNPHLGIANKALVQMRAYLSEFGLTPASRSRVTVSAKPKNQLEAFRQKRHG